MQVRPGRAIFWNAPQRSTILTVPWEVVMQQMQDILLALSRELRRASGWAVGGHGQRELDVVGMGSGS